MQLPPNLGIKPGYRACSTPSCSLDLPDPALICQPHVYELAGFLGSRSGARYIIDIGCSDRKKLLPLAHDFRIWLIGVDGSKQNMAPCLRADHVSAHNLEQGLPELPREVLESAIVVCSDVIERLVDPSPLLASLAGLSRQCRYLLVSTPDRTRARGIGDFGPPGNPSHVREWTIDEFDTLLRSAGFSGRMVGYSVNTNIHLVKSTILVISGVEAAPRISLPVPLLAIMSVYNEADIIEETVRHLIAQGAIVCIIDNWSTDGSYEMAQTLVAETERVAVTRFPESPTSEYEWQRLLEHAELIAGESDFRWIFHNDADELRYSPWRGVTLAQALGFVDALGYNTVDFTVLDFRFLRGAEENGRRRYEESLRHFEFGRRPGHFQQIKGWRNQGGTPVHLAEAGGHEVRFPGRRVFPLKFLLKHYPLRTVAQANRKVFADRLPRTERERAEKNWHTQYESFRGSTIDGFERYQLIPWSDHLFESEYLVERLSGIGIR